MKQDIGGLTEAILIAAKKSFLSLFENDEQYYYCTLLTTGEGPFPVISAWSYEALQRETCQASDPQEEKELIKWSYADSPYYNYGENNFEIVKAILSERPNIDELEIEEWDRELGLRLLSMELAMKKIDEDGVFSLNQPRESVLIVAELMTPDKINAEIASRLNRRSKLLTEYIYLMIE